MFRNLDVTVKYWGSGKDLGGVRLEHSKLTGEAG